MLGQVGAVEAAVPQFGASLALASLNDLHNLGPPPTPRNEKCGYAPSLALRFGQRDSDRESRTTRTLRRGKLAGFPAA